MSMWPSRKGLRPSGFTICWFPWRNECSSAAHADGMPSPRRAIKIDADQLSELLRLGAVTSVFHATKDAATLRELVRDYLNLVDDATRTKSRIKPLFRARGIRTAGRAAFRHDQRTHWI